MLDDISNMLFNTKYILAKVRWYYLTYNMEWVRLCIPFTRKLTELQTSFLWCWSPEHQTTCYEWLSLFLKKYFLLHIVIWYQVCLSNIKMYTQQNHSSRFPRHWIPYTEGRWSKNFSPTNSPPKNRCCNNDDISSSSLYRAASTDIPDPLSPLLPIIHCFKQVFIATFRILI